MQIRIQCFSQIRSITKQQFVNIEIPQDTTLIGAVKSFAEQFGNDMQEMLFSDGKLRSFYSLQVDSKQIAPDEYSTLVVKEGQTITILPYIAGG
ncbi:MAG: MoaD/ThiS family protein [Candidatus Heimdallarchaeaceae archaeon]